MPYSLLFQYELFSPSMCVLNECENGFIHKSVPFRTFILTFELRPISVKPLQVKMNVINDGCNIPYEFLLISQNEIIWMIENGSVGMFATPCVCCLSETSFSCLTNTFIGVTQGVLRYKHDSSNRTYSACCTQDTPLLGNSSESLSVTPTTYKHKHTHNQFPEKFSTHQNLNRQTLLLDYIHYKLLD